jgi:hypothetical protein
VGETRVQETIVRSRRLAFVPALQVRVAPKKNRFHYDAIASDDSLYTYAYVGGNPLRLIDPFGLKSRVCCKNIPFVQRFVPGGMADARHCYIETQNSTRTTFGLFGGPDTPDGNGYTLRDTRFDREPPQGDCGPWSDDCGADECVASAASSYPNPTYYGVITSNSNTFAGTVARKCNLRRPPGNFPTPGWGDPPARPATGAPQVPFNTVPPRSYPVDPFSQGGG